MSAAVLVSNRGPLAHDLQPDGSLIVRRGAGGLVSGLTPLVEGSDVLWLASALSEGDRAVAGRPVHNNGFHCQFVLHDPEVLRLAYDVVGNGVLWSLHHGIFDLAREPVFDAQWHAAWQAYREYNDTFAEAIASVAPVGATILVQDYHLTLLALTLRRTRVDLRIVHFSHTPFASPDWLRVLPEAARSELLSAMAAFHACGFHCERWRQGFLGSCEAFDVQPPVTFVSALSPDAAGLANTFASPPTQAALRSLRSSLVSQRVVVRVDRMEPSKNLLRGFQAFDELLASRPDLQGKVTFLACLYPSRLTLPSYQRYRLDVEHVVRWVNERWQSADWTPIRLETTDDYPRSVAALALAEVLVVNPIRDGMNLVAKEGPLVSLENLQLVLSTETGAWDELGGAAFGVNPFDITATAKALADALDIDGAQRSNKARMLREFCAKRSPQDWFADQLAAANAAASAES